MNAFVSALLAAIMISYVASVVLDNNNPTVDQSFVGQGARPDLEPKLLDVKPPAKKS